MKDVFGLSLVAIYVTIDRLSDFMRRLWRMAKLFVFGGMEVETTKDGNHRVSYRGGFKRKIGRTGRKNNA